MRTKLFHTLFSYGKMHSVAKATAEEHDLPFRTTISFAKQRFLSSSYQQFVRLENSFAAYVETYRDHDNKEINEYKLAGQDFVFDLLGLIDLLRPILLLILRGQLLWCPGWKLVPWLNQTVKQLQFFSDEICQAKPSKLAAPNIHRHVEDICAMKFKDVDLVDGWLVEDDTSGKPTEWKMRELDDCRSDLKNLAVGMNEEIKRRRVDGLPKLLELLSDCLDFGELFRCLVGRRVNMDRFEIDKPQLARYGRDQFRQCVEFIARLPYVKEVVDTRELELDKDCSELIFWKLKDTLLKTIWGELFQTYFPRFFAKLEKENVQVPIQLKSEQLISSFAANSSGNFDLLDKFEICLTGGEEFTAVLKEDCIIQSLYNDPEFYESVGREYCVIFDIMYAKAGTEAIAESIYRVMETQEMNGGQSHDVLSLRTKVDWSLPSVLQCEAALDSMIDLYLKGDKEKGLKRHYLPVYKDKRSIRKSGELSKVLLRHAETKTRLPFLL